MSKVISVLGIAFSVLLLTFNLAYFPEPPGEVGSIDFGPIVALWYMVLLVWLAMKHKSISALE
jgi:hypothetical protein